MKHALIPALFVLLSVAAKADGHKLYGMAGCGLGTQVMGAEGNQILAGTTNGTSWNQPFAISSGTSNCMEHKKMGQARAQETFFYDHIELLAKEMAQGDGPHLKALAQTFECDNSSYPEFAKTMQSSYGEIFSAPGAVASLNTLRDKVLGSEQLANSCKGLI